MAFSYSGLVDLFTRRGIPRELVEQEIAQLLQRGHNPTAYRVARRLCVPGKSLERTTFDYARALEVLRKRRARRLETRAIDDSAARSACLWGAWLADTRGRRTSRRSLVPDPEDLRFGDDRG